MLLTRLINRTCTITSVTATGTEDVFGDPAEATTTTTTVCHIWQKRSDETTTGLAVGDEQWGAVFPAGTVIDHSDRVTVDGVTYEVDGPPWAAENPFSRSASHVEATLRRTR